MPRHSRKASRRGGQEPIGRVESARGEREEGEIVGPRMPPPAAPPASTATPGFSNEPSGTGWNSAAMNAPATGQGRRRSRRGSRKSRKSRKVSRRR
jgi:hypothetical protein